MQRLSYVTGSNGFLGINLCAELIRQDWRVLALHRRNSDLRYLDQFAVEKLEGDINDPASLDGGGGWRVQVRVHRPVARPDA